LKYSVSGAGIIAEIVDFVFQTNRTFTSRLILRISAVPTFATGFDWHSQAISTAQAALGSIIEFKRIEGRNL